MGVGEEGGKQRSPNPEGKGPAEPGEASTAEGGDAMEVDGQGVDLCGFVWICVDSGCGFVWICVWICVDLAFKR